MRAVPAEALAASASGTMSASGFDTPYMIGDTPAEQQSRAQMRSDRLAAELAFLPLTLLVAPGFASGHVVYRHDGQPFSRPWPLHGE
jgi:hypothetical protein